MVTYSMALEMKLVVGDCRVFIWVFFRRKAVI